MEKLAITVFLTALGATREEQVPNVARLLRTLADELEAHGRIGEGDNHCALDDASTTVAVFRLEP